MIKNKYIFLILLLFVNVFICMGVRLLSYSYNPDLFGMPGGISPWFMEQAIRCDLCVFALLFSIPSLCLILSTSAKSNKIWVTFLMGLLGFVCVEESIMVLNIKTYNAIGDWFSGIICGTAFGCITWWNNRYIYCFQEAGMSMIYKVKVLVLGFCIFWTLLCGFTPLKGPLTASRLAKTCDNKGEIQFIENKIFKLFYN